MVEYSIFKGYIVCSLYSLPDFAILSHLTAHFCFIDFNKIFANIEICYENDNEDANEEVINIEKIKR